jgi:ABC-2 type transport system ATP-binding protein
MGYCSQAIELNGDILSPAPSVDNGQSVLDVSNLNYGYGRGVMALQEVNFSLQRGGFHALLGPNGAGKSTLFALLTRLFVPQQGTIQLFGRDLIKGGGTALANLGVVFQQSTLDLDLSVEQNLLYHGALHGLGRREVRQRMESDLSAFGLESRTRDKVRKLNGGHRRRLEIVRSLLHGPNLLLLDEPTVGLDLESRQYLNERVRQLCSQRGLSVLWATHLMEEVRDSDQVLLLHRGQLCAQGTSAELCREMAADSITLLFNRLTGEGS